MKKWSICFSFVSIDYCGGGVTNKENANCYAMGGGGGGRGDWEKKWITTYNSIKLCEIE